MNGSVSHDMVMKEAESAMDVVETGDCSQEGQVKVNRFVVYGVYALLKNQKHEARIMRFGNFTVAATSGGVIAMVTTILHGFGKAKGWW